MFGTSRYLENLICLKRPCWTNCKENKKFKKLFNFFYCQYFILNLRILKFLMGVTIVREREKYTCDAEVKQKIGT